jgi:hypothetical protein
MSGLIDQHELGGALTDLINEDYVTSGSRGRNGEDGGGSTGGSIRRTKQ